MYKFFTCRNSKCKKKFSTKRAVFIQKYWYIRPYSCTGGDYWALDERNIICPECSVLHRLLSKDADKKYGRAELYDKVIENREDDYWGDGPNLSRQGKHIDLEDIPAALGFDPNVAFNYGFINVYS